MSQFPLLQLPLVSLKDTLKCLNPIELFRLSQCSEKMIETIKLAGTRKFRLSVDFGCNFTSINENYHFISRFTTKDTFNELKRSGNRNFELKINQIEFSVQLGPDNINYVLITCWVGKILGMKTICLYLSEIFGCIVNTFDTGYDISAVKFQSISEEILNKQNEIPSLLLKAEQFTEDDLKWALDNVRATEKLTIHNFNYKSVKLLRRIDIKTIPKILIIHSSSWFTLENLISLESCVMVKLSNSNLSNQDLDVFITLWKSGNYSKLEYLQVSSNKLNDKESIAGLIGMSNAESTTNRSKSIIGYYYYIGKGMDIRRDDGIIGTMKLERNCLQLLV